MREILKNRPDVPVTKSFDDHKNLFRHFKGNWYEFMYICKNSEKEGEELVIYKSLYDSEDGKVHKGDLFCRPLDMFYSEVDKEKYPNIKQKYRFMNYYELIKQYGEIKVNMMLKQDNISF